MKKLLLLSLLAMGVTSFAAVEGSADRAEMQITVRESVIDKSSTNLIIEPMKNAGVNGSAMEFDFGGLFPGATQSLEGTFAVYKGDGTQEITDAAKTISIGILQTDRTTLETDKTADVGGSKVGLGYVVSSTTNSARTKIKGSIAVTATVDANAEKGTFLDTTKKLAVIIE